MPNSIQLRQVDFCARWDDCESYVHGVGIIRESACWRLCRARHNRHTFGTRAADAGVPLGAVAAVMGHADIHTTMRYAHATDEGKRRAVEAIEQTTKSRSQIGPRRQSDLAQMAVNS